MKEFKLRGQLTHGGRGLAGLFIAVVDDDMFDGDDLIGMGTTDAEGRFRLSFLPSEFQQDLFEDEETPDLRIVVSRRRGEALEPIYQRKFEQLYWRHGKVDLGALEIPDFDLDTMPTLAGVEPMPGHDKRVKRLELDDDLLRHCLAEVAPIVERLTGWTDLLDGVNVAVSDGIVKYSLQDSFAREGIEPDSFQAKLATFIAEYGQASGAGCALYEPNTHTIVVNRTIMEQVNLDGLKSMLGHELVHLGQFKYTPGLKAYNKAMVQGLELDPEKVDLASVAERFAYMNDMEGYAVYIQTDFLQRDFYNLAAYPYHQSLTDSILRGLVALITPNAKENQDLKAAQYTDGREVFRQRQQGDLPARWDLDVGQLPGGAEFVG